MARAAERNGSAFAKNSRRVRAVELKFDLQSFHDAKGRVTAEMVVVSTSCELIRCGESQQEFCDNKDAGFTAGVQTPKRTITLHEQRTWRTELRAGTPVGVATDLDRRRVLVRICRSGIN